MVDDIMVSVDRMIVTAMNPPFFKSEGSGTAPASAAGRDECLVYAKIGKGIVVENNGYREEGCSENKELLQKDVRECRICQEEDDELALESPCACNGTLKFAHRKCIQRWCNKKGDITCEICSQVFSPNYSLPPARTNPDVMTIDIRQAWGSHISIRDHQLLALAAAERQFLQSEYDEYAVANSSSVVCLRSVAISLMFILLIRQILMIIRDFGMVQESSTFVNVQISLLQLAGVVLPCYVLARSWHILRRRRQV
uniref:Zinc finger protein n=1 Tax=Tamarix hispida TaxID=189793 RepID=A0A0A1G621_9CARY|nr:zinc finger protein [Tamarix hispida]